MDEKKLKNTAKKGMFAFAHAKIQLSIVNDTIIQWFNFQFSMIQLCNYTITQRYSNQFELII